MKKKWFTVKAVLKGNAPDFGMGKGVILEQELGFTDARNRGFKSPMFAIARINHEHWLCSELLRFEWTEKRQPKPKSKKSLPCPKSK